MIAWRSLPTANLKRFWLKIGSVNKAFFNITKKLWEIADLLEGETFQKSRSENNSIKKKTKKKKKGKRKTIKHIGDMEKLEMIAKEK